MAVTPEVASSSLVGPATNPISHSVLAFLAAACLPTGRRLARNLQARDDRASAWTRQRPPALTWPICCRH